MSFLTGFQDVILSVSFSFTDDSFFISLYCLFIFYFLFHYSLPSPYFFFFWLYHTACGISVLQPWIEPRSWQWKAGILTVSQQGTPLIFYYEHFQACKKVTQCWFSHSHLATLVLSRICPFLSLLSILQSVLFLTCFQDICVCPLNILTCVSLTRVEYFYKLSLCCTFYIQWVHTSQVYTCWPFVSVYTNISR